MPKPSPNVTELLRAWTHGEKAALDQLIPVVYDELRRQASRYLRRELPGHTLQTTALVNEAYVRLVDQNFIAQLPPERNPLLGGHRAGDKSPAPFFGYKRSAYTPAESLRARCLPGLSPPAPGPALGNPL